MQIIAVANHKGGCGKTTTSINLAYCLSQLKKRVLLVDLDPQGHATLGLNIDPDKLERSMYHLLTPISPKEFKDIVLHPYRNLDLLPGNMQVSYLEQMLAGKNRREYRLQDALRRNKNYDYVIIDTAPSLGLLTINALLAAQKVVIPLEPGNYALHGLQKLEETIQMLGKKLEHELKVKYLVTLYNTTSKFCTDFEHTIRPFFEKNLLHTRINYSDIYRSAAALGLPVQVYDKETPEALEYQNVAREVLTWVENIEPSFISSLPKTKKSPVAFTIKSALAQEHDYVELLKKTDHEYQYKYVVDINGNIGSVKVDNFNIPERVLH